VPQHVIQRGHNRQATCFADTNDFFYRECLGDGQTGEAHTAQVYFLLLNVLIGDENKMKAIFTTLALLCLYLFGSTAALAATSNLIQI